MFHKNRNNKLKTFQAEWTIEKSKPPNNWPSNGKISFDNYSVKYREELENVLNKITANIEPGEKIGIVGRTGNLFQSFLFKIFLKLI